MSRKPEKPKAEKPRPAAPAEVKPPTEFPAYDESIPFAYRCPRCSYVWSGKPK
jgi:hypothetical protein